MIENPLEGLDVGAVENKVKVLYIAGWGRSGSTVLGRILGQVEDFFMVGELRYVWDQGLIENKFCTCGAPFRECTVWQEIMSRTLEEGDGQLDAQELVDLRERGLKSRHVLLTPTRRSLRARVARMGKYLDTSERLYRAIRDVSRSKVIVDTSKFPSYAYLLRNVPNIELYLLHLVRDPRAVAYSWGSRRKMTSHNLIKSSLIWNEWNLGFERIRRREPKRYMLLRYEDFVESPRNAAKNILRFLGEEKAEPPFVNEREISLDPSHVVYGNPDRFRSGTMKIESDEEWRHKMSAIRQATVTTLTWPGLVHYGYPFRPQRDSIAPRASFEGS